MPDGVTIATSRDDDPFGWALDLAGRLRLPQSLPVADRQALSEILEEWAAEMLGTVQSQIVNLLAHAVKAAFTRNPDVVGHWRSECTEFHDRLINAYRPSMRGKIDLPALWRRAQRKVMASFDDHGEPRPTLPAQCPVPLDDLIDPGLDVERLVKAIGGGD
ncbi:MAG TPA: DUF29 family protein [Stellaceae bacterium]|nr:DUF29 family protein [Stellaceae bacterium]